MGPPKISAPEIGAPGPHNTGKMGPPAPFLAHAQTFLLGPGIKAREGLEGHGWWGGSMGDGVWMRGGWSTWSNYCLSNNN